MKKVEFPLPVAVPWLSGLHGLSPQDGVHGPEDGVHGPEDAANGPWPARSVPPGSIQTFWKTTWKQNICKASFTFPITST